MDTRSVGGITESHSNSAVSRAIELLILVRPACSGSVPAPSQHEKENHLDIKQKSSQELLENPYSLLLRGI